VDILDIATGSVIGKCWPRHRAIEFRKFLEQIDRALPADLTVNLGQLRYPQDQRHSPNGRWIQFTYDSNSRVTVAQDNIGRKVQYTYDSGECRIRQILVNALSEGTAGTTKHCEWNSIRVYCYRHFIAIGERLWWNDNVRAQLFGLFRMCFHIVDTNKQLHHALPFSLCYRPKTAMNALVASCVNLAISEGIVPADFSAEKRRIEFLQLVWLLRKDLPPHHRVSHSSLL
jgi:YD repeat-containing protein